MNINRNNYEEYFLLYADNELSPQQKNMVELFVQQNADLEEELVMLQQSVVKPDKNIILEDKSFLFKQQTFINQNNYEEIFVLYNDNELNEDEKRETEKFVADNPRLQSEFALLQRAKLEADAAIVFPDKRLLYKKEERVIPVMWWRIAAAAVLVGLGLWGGITYLQKNKVEQPIAIRKNIEQPKKIITVPVDKKEQVTNEPQQNIASANGDQTQNKKAEKQIIKDNTSAHQTKKLIVPNQNTLVKNNTPIQKAIEKNINNPLEQNKQETVVKEPQKKIDDIITPTKNKDKVNTNELATTDNIYNAPSETNARPASYVSDEKNDNYVFYNVSEEKFKKSKLFGFLKKVKRVIQRESPFNHNTDNKEVAAK